MQRATFTLSSNGDGNLRFPYNPDLVEELKLHIPKPCRKWSPEAKVWWIAAEYVNLASRLAEGYFDVDHIDAPGSHQQSRAAPPPPPPRPLHADPYEVLHLRSSAPPELVAAAARTLAKIHHPDLKPEHEKALATTAMARINRAVEDLRRRGVA